MNDVKKCANCKMVTDMDARRCPNCGSSCFESINNEQPAQGQDPPSQAGVPELIDGMGIETVTGIEHIFSSGTPLPAGQTRNFSTVTDNQTELEIHLFAGNSKITKECRHLLDITLTGIEKKPKGIPQIQVTFKIDKEGLVITEAKDVVTGRPIEIEASFISVRMGWRARPLEKTRSPDKTRSQTQTTGKEPKPDKQTVSTGDNKRSEPAAAPRKTKTETAATKEEPASDFNLSNRSNEILLKIARPDIYHINSFRVLEIPVTASLKDAKNQMHKLDVKEKLGLDGHVDRGLLPLVPVPDADARREAQQRLENPESRLVDELFWFWPLAAGLTEENDEALASMKRNDFSDAVSIWKQHETNASESNVSMHNLAIMYHVLALDIEQVQSTQTISAKQSQQKREYWEQAYFRWNILLNHDGFWSRLTNRIREMDDLRLTTGAARRLQKGLPLVLVTINAMLAVRAAQLGNTNEARYHLGLINKSGFNKEAIAEALRQATVPIIDRIKVMCASAESESKNDPTKGDEIIGNFFKQVTPELTTLDIILPKGHAIRDSAHDEVASIILPIVVAFCEKTSKRSETQKIMEQALSIAASESIRQRIERNIEVNKSNMEYGTCWFCKKNPSDEGAAIVVKMHGEVTRTPTYRGTNIKWRKIDIKVPRCNKCKALHDKKSKYKSTQGGWGCAGFAIGTVLAFIFGVFVENGWGAIISFVIFGLAGLLIPVAMKPTKSNIRDEDYKNEFPDVKKQKAEGWSFGEKPADAN
jgi:hypothetical protein